MPPAIQIAHLDKTFAAPRGSKRPRKALDDLSLNITAGEMVALIGPSGSGKSTLLRNVSGLAIGDRRPRAWVSVDGQPIQQAGRLTSGVRQARSRIGFVFQQFNLVGRLSVLGNVLTGRLGQVPLWRGLLSLWTREEKRAAMVALARVGISEIAGQRASTLSGGQQQRAAIARTLMQGAKVILADEPIASLDPESARRVMEILAQINREDGVTVMVTLHQVDYATRYCQRVVALREGVIVFDGAPEELTPALLRDIYGAELDFALPTSAPVRETPPRAAERSRQPAEAFRLGAVNA